MAEFQVISRKNDKRACRSTFYSLDEFAEVAEREGDVHDGYGDLDWTGGETFERALEMARNGWADKLDETLEIAESAVSMCEREHEVMRPEMRYDVTGDSVDIGRYLSGEPECMIDYPLMPTSKVGRVITLCASIAWSASIDPDVIVRRGQIIAALALALTRLGHSCELWADHSINMHGKSELHDRILIKGCDDTIDPAKIVYGFAHPSMLRHLGFAVNKNVPHPYKYHGVPIAPERDLPEGTIYMPELCSGHNLPDAHETLKGYLREIGLLAEGGE